MSKAPTAMHNAKIICSQAFAYKSQKEATAKAQAEMEALKKKMEEMQQEQQIATAQINASKKDLYGMRQGDVTPKGKEELDDSVQITAGAQPEQDGAQSSLFQAGSCHDCICNCLSHLNWRD